MNQRATLTICPEYNNALRCKSAPAKNSQPLSAWIPGMLDTIEHTSTHEWGWELEAWQTLGSGENLLQALCQQSTECSPKSISAALISCLLAAELINSHTHTPWHFSFEQFCNVLCTWPLPCFVPFICKYDQTKQKQNYSFTCCQMSTFTDFFGWCVYLRLVTFWWWVIIEGNIKGEVEPTPDYLKKKKKQVLNVQLDFTSSLVTNFNLPSNSAILYN